MGSDGSVAVLWRAVTLKSAAPFGAGGDASQPAGAFVTTCDGP